MRAVTPEGLHAGLAGLTDTTITAADAIIFSDATDSGKLKEDTVQGILDLALPYVAPSTSGNVLTSNGSAWTSAAAPAGGALVILAEDTNVTVATKTFTGLDLTPYNIVYFELQRYNNESGGSNGYLTMEISVDNGSTWLSTNKWVHFRAEGTGTWSFGSQGNSVAAMQICTFQWPDLDQYLWGEMIFTGGHGSECQIYTRSIGDKSTGSNIVSGTSHAVSTDTSGNDIDAIRFATTVDDFGGAEIRIWGGMK